MAIEHGRVVRLRVGSTPGVSVAGDTSATLNLEGATVDTTVKGSWPWTENIPGWLSWSVEGEALVGLTDTGLFDIEDAWIAQTQVTIAVDVNARTYTGAGTVTKFSINGPRDDAASASYTINGTSTLTRSGTGV